MWSFVMRCRQAFYERIYLPSKEKYQQGNPLRVRKISKNRFFPHIILCWWYRDVNALIRQRNNICRILAPKDEYVRAARSFAEEIRNKNATLIGVHVRRGDYREFCGGRYFFSDEEYVRFMRMVKISCDVI